jgi:hypothetical protein
MGWWVYLVFRIPEVAVVLVGLVLALARRRTLRGRAAGLAIGGLAALLVAMILNVALTIMVFTVPRVRTDALSPYALGQILGTLLFVGGLALVVAAVFAGRRAVPVPSPYDAWGAPAAAQVAGGWTPPQQAEPGDWRTMSGVWSLPRGSFDQPPRSPDS